MPLIEARTVATSVLVLVGLYLILALEAAGRRRGAAVTGLCGALLLLYVLTLAIGGTRDFFELAVPGFWALLAIAGGTALTVSLLWLTDDRFVPDLRPRREEGEGNEARVR